MDDPRGRYRFPLQEFDMSAGTNSAVLTQAFVTESLEREERRDDGLNAARGALNALLFGVAFWIAIGLAIFLIF
jgi:hypothetical protein